MDLLIYKQQALKLKQRFSLTYDKLNHIYLKIKHLSNDEFLNKCTIILSTKPYNYKLTEFDFLPPLVGELPEETIDLNVIEFEIEQREEKKMFHVEQKKTQTQERSTTNFVQEELKKRGAASWVEAMEGIKRDEEQGKKRG